MPDSSHSILDQPSKQGIIPTVVETHKNIIPIGVLH